jgi:predicted RNA-binding protein with PIN domain
MDQYIKQKIEKQTKNTAKIIIDTSDLSQQQVLHKAYTFLL